MADAPRPYVYPAQFSGSRKGNLHRCAQPGGFGLRRSGKIVNTGTIANQSYLAAMFPSLTPDPRLLAIEDDPTLGAHLFQHLNGSGFEVTWCRDGEEVGGCAQRRL